jgi:hypothetical protein
MAKLNKLITYAYLREEVDLPQNIPDPELEHSVYRSQEMLRMLMGDDFYQDYLTAYKNNTMSAAYTSVFPYIKQFVAWQAYQFWTVKANFKPTRSGIRVHTEANSQPASDIQLSIVIKDAKAQAEYYKNLMVSYIDGHASDYPLYSNGCGNNLTGNSFHISAVKKRGCDTEPYGRRSGCRKC